MAYTGDPANNPIDAVRLLVGDTDPSAEILTDAEYQYFLDLTNNAVIPAAILAARTIAAKYALLVNEEVGEVKISYEQRYKHYIDLAARLEDQISSPAIKNPLRFVSFVIKTGKVSLLSVVYL